MKNANPVSLALVAAVALALAVFTPRWGPGKPAQEAADPKTVSDHFAVAIGGHPTSLQFAVLDAEQQRGLMQRPDLGRDEGMIFVNPAPRRDDFWMKDTPEALDIAFAGRDGVIAEIYPLYPFNLAPVRSQSDQIEFAVEMRQGWYAENQVRPGTAIDLGAVAAALKARGFEPAKYGMPAGP